jgi:TPR repeat protein
MWEYFEAWDDAQANDQALFDSDPYKDELNEITDPHEAFQRALSLAERGSVAAMIGVGTGYLYGRLVKADTGLGEDWYRRAAEHGSRYAQLRLGKALGARGDFDGCEQVFTIGADQNWAPAQFWLAWYRLRRSRTRATYLEVQPLLEKASAQGSPAARWLLGKRMSRGTFGIRHIPRGIRMMLELGDELAPVCS